MSYTVETAGGNSLPGQVRTARTLLYAGAALMAIYGALAAVQSTYTSDVTVEGQSVPGLTGPLGIGFSIAIYAPLAIGLAVLGTLIGKGKNPARIVTWVVDGLIVLCCGCGLLAEGLTSALMSNLDEASADVYEQITAATPGWLSAALVVVSLLILGSQIAVIILLALPASNEFFRKEEQVWVPPAWPAGGGQPPMPPAPGANPPPATGPMPPPSGPTPPGEPPSDEPPGGRPPA